MRMSTAVSKKSVGILPILTAIARKVYLSATVKYPTLAHAPEASKFALIVTSVNSITMHNVKGIYIDTNPTDTNRSVADSPRGEDGHVFVSMWVVSIQRPLNVILSMFAVS